MNEVARIRELARERMLATGFILGCDRTRYGSMIRDFENAFTTGKNMWPKVLADAYRTLTNWKRDHSSGGIDNDGVSFGVDAQEGKDRGRSNKRCYHCNKIGHISRDCPQKEGTTNTQDAEAQDDEGAGETTGEQLLIQAASSREFDAQEHFSFCQVATNVQTTDHRSVALNMSGSSIPKSWI